jgi:RNase P/RNase MRP subunit POP5
MKTQHQRYILFHLITDKNQKLDQEVIMKTLWRQLSELFGDNESFHAGLWMIRFNFEHQTGILRCDHIAKLQVITAMAFIKEIKGIPVIFHTRKTSGTIKKTIKIWKEIFPQILVPKREEEN